MKALLVLSSLFALASCMPSKSVDGEASSGNISANAPYIWDSSVFPLDLRISNAYTNAAEVSNIQAMTTAWETSVGNNKNFFVNPSGVMNRTPEVDSTSLNLDSLGSDGVLGIYRITRWPSSLNSGALAVTQLFGRRYNIGSSNEYVRIEHADILMNENLYDFRTDDTSTGWTYDFRTVVLHEMGHFLGLSHKYGDTVMVPSVNTSSQNRAPKNIDRSDIATKYSISLGTSSAPALSSGPKVNYVPNSGDQGKELKILIELMADGECVHKENGAVVLRHSSKSN